MPELFVNILIYVIAINILGAVFVIIDKYNAVHKFMRIPEKALMFLGVIGGASVMYTVMKIIRHKTKKKKFMLTFPLMILAHIVILFFILKGYV